ncbi:YdgA family protein [Thalassotalea litorea]|nr:YdgA family protein [Thalassotalea litorea]
MKKVILAVALGVALASPYLIGFKAEEHIKDSYAKVSSNPAFDIEITRYDRGYLNSTAHIAFTMPVEVEAGVIETLTFESEHQVQHGPILWTADGLGFGLADSQMIVGLPTDFKQEIINIDDIASDSLTSFARTSFGGSTYSTITIKPTTLELQDSNLELLAGELHSTITPEGKVTGTGQWQGMKIIESGVEVFVIGATKLDVDQTYILGDVFSPTSLGVGTGNFSISHIRVNGETPDASMNIQDISLVSDSYVEENLLAATVTVKAKSLSIAMQEFSDFNYSMSMDKLNVNVLSELQKLLVNVQSDDPQQQQMLMMEIQQQLPKLLADNPRIAIDNLGVTTSEGDIVSDLLITIDPQKFDAANPMSMMFALQADAKGSAPSAFFEKLGMQENIDALKQQGMVVQDAEQLTFKFSFSDGQALINGVAIPLG